MDRRKRSVKMAVGFLAVMLALTFFSRTIYRSGLTVVQIIRPSGGTLKYQYTVADFSICTDAPVYEYIPFEWSRGMTVSKCLVRLGDVVQPGDDLVIFYAPEGELLLAEATKERLSAEEEWQMWQSQLQTAIRQAEEKLHAAQNRPEIEAARNALALLEAGIMNGNSTRAVETRLREAEEREDCLTALQKNGWVYRATESGTVCRVDVEQTQRYTGISPLLCLGETVYLEAEIPDGPQMHMGQWKWTAQAVGQKDREMLQVMASEGKRVQLAAPEIMKAGQIAEMTLWLESPYENTLLPNSAVQDKFIFTLEAETGDWGQTIYRVHRTEIRPGNRDSANTVILEGIEPRDQVVRSAVGLVDGQRVLLEGYE